MQTRQGWAARLGAMLPGRRARSGGAGTAAGAGNGYGAAIEASLALDQEIGRKLDEAVGRTEASALAIMQQVRALCDGSAALTERLQQAMVDAGAFEEEVADNVTALAHMGRFLECLPARLQHDLDCISAIAGEIKSLSGLAESVEAISMQSHLLSINAAIEASRAGSAGVAFKVVADEVRVLAANSNAAAKRIGGSLERIRATLTEGLEGNAARSADDLSDIAQATQAVARMQASYGRCSGTYRAGLADMIEHGGALAAGSSDVLGQLQYQDVVRQCVERLQDAIARRNDALGQEFFKAAAPQPELLARLIGDIAADYLATETLHGGDAAAHDTGPAIELF